MINHNLFNDFDKIVCGVSGGADSIALVYALKKLEKSRNIKIFACHLNHKTRFEESERDLNFTKDFCKKHDIPFYFEEIDIVLDKSKGFEASARQIRYDFFNRALVHFSADKIATAHNCDDNLETILLNITRGSGIRGVCGIPHSRLNIIRPILHKTRYEIEQYILDNSLDYIVDSSNNTDDYSRNKIRHHILPVLREINTKATQNSYIMSKSVSDDADFLDDLANDYYYNLVYINNFSFKINAFELSNLKKPLSYRVLSKILSNFNKVLTYVYFNKILDMCKSSNPSISQVLYNDIEIFKEYDTIIFKEKKIICENLTFEVNSSKIIVSTNMLEDLAKSYDVDFKKIDFESFEVTKRQQGDSISLKSGTKSLKKLFIDKKIPKKTRDFIPVLRDKNGIIGVCFIGVDIKRQSENNEKIIFRSI